MSALEVREIARLVIEAGGTYDDLCELVRLWELSRDADASSAHADQLVTEIIETFDAIEIDEYGSPVSPESDNAAIRRVERAARRMFPPGVRALINAKKDARSLAIDCPHRAHAGREWRRVGSERWTCGVCHPPASGVQVEWRRGP